MQVIVPNNQTFYNSIEFFNFRHYFSGGEEGFIEGAMEIYPVKKKDANGDYHDNVNAKVFTQWFKKLIEILDGTNRKYIIVG